MFKLLTGRNVHEAATLNEQLVSAATKPAPPLRRLLPTASSHLATVVDRALAFTKADRWPDARAMQEAMRPALAREVQGCPTSGPPPSSLATTSGTRPCPRGAAARPAPATRAARSRSQRPKPTPLRAAGPARSSCSATYVRDQLEVNRRRWGW